MKVVLYVYVISLAFTSLPADGAKIKSRIGVREEQVPGTPILYMETIFNDGGRSNFRNVRYKLLQGSTADDGGTQHTPWVDLDEETGALILNRKIDRERDCVQNLIQCTLVLQVVRLPQKVFKIAEMTLSIEDINDNPPRFPDQETVISIGEDTEVGHEIDIDAFQASDADAPGNNSVVRYSISSSRAFGLKQFNDRSGENHLRLVVRQKLDYAKRKIHNLRLTARDQGKPKKLSSELKIQIHVEDANDNSPVFGQQLYEVTLKESHGIGDVITQVHADDADKGKLGQVTYWLGSASLSNARNTELVSINQQSGVVRLQKKLNKSLHDGTRIVLEARDGAEDGVKTGKTILLIRVVDVNDHTPEISINYIVDAKGNIAYVPESATINTFLAHVSATDADNEENGEIRFEIDGFLIIKDEKTNTTKFKKVGCFVLTAGGLLATTCLLDRESQDRYKIEIHACDKGIPPNCRTEEIYVIVLDENEYPPMFANPVQSVTLPEDSSVGYHIANCIAYDGDSDRMNSAYSKNQIGEIVRSKNGEISYRMQAEDSKGNLYDMDDEPPFGFDALTGRVFLMRPLDYEKSKTWKIRIIAEDLDNKSPKSNSCNVTVFLDDIIDNRPVFTNPAEHNSTIYVSLKSEGNEVIQFKAIDFNQDTAVQIRYSLQSVFLEMRDSRLQGLKKHPFSLNSTTGELSLIEKTQKYLGKYFIEVQAFDSSNRTTSKNVGLFVVVTELSDEAIQQLHKEVTNASAAFTVAIGLGIAAVLLLILSFVVLVVLIRRRRSAHENDAKPEEENGNMRRIDNEEKKSKSSVKSAQSSKNKHDRRTDVCNMGKDTSPGECYVCNLSRSSLTDHSPCHVHALTENKNMIQMTSSPSDHDSGRGSSDAKSDVANERIQPKDSVSEELYCAYPLAYSSKQQVTPIHEKPYANPKSLRVTDKMGPNCTPACREIGHSDSCWMPKGLQVRNITQLSECSSDATSSSGSSFQHTPLYRKTSSSFPVGGAVGRRRSGEYPRSMTTSDSSNYQYDRPRTRSRVTSQTNENSLEARDSRADHLTKMTRETLEDDVFKSREKTNLSNSIAKKGDYISLGSSINSGASTETTFVDNVILPPAQQANVRRTSSLTKTAVV